MLTQDQIKANINAMEQQGATQSEIQQYLDSLKGSTTNTPQPSTPESGFLKNVLQSLVHVPATLVSTLASLGADVKSFAGAAGSGFKTMDFSEGDKIRQQGLDLGIFGNVKPVGGDINNQTFGGLAGNVAGLAGNAALDVATLGSDSLAKAVGESTLKQVGNIAAKNAGIGAGYGLASSVENGDNWLDTLLHTVEGAAVGGIAGPALHYAIPAVAKTVGGVASDVIDKGVVGGLESTANKIGNKIDTTTSKIFGNVPEGEVGKITIPKNVAIKPTPETSLIQEARKYKSAEEFVKAQGTPVYHGSDKLFTSTDEIKFGDDVFYTLKRTDGELKELAESASPDNYWSYDDLAKMPANAFGKEVSEFIVNFKNPKIVDAKGKGWMELTDGSMSDWTNKIVQQATKSGKKYDGIIIKNIEEGFSGNGTLGASAGLVDDYIVLNKSAIKTKSQLEEIWKNANKTNADDALIQEAKKYKSAEEFVKAQGTTLYHGSPEAKNIKSIDINKLGEGELGKGFYLSPKKEIANHYTIKGVSNTPSSGILEFSDNGLNTFVTTKGGVGGFTENAIKYGRDKYISMLKKQGYDGIETLDNGQIVVFPESVNKIKTKSQLTDIWNKANKIGNKIDTTTSKIFDNTLKPTINVGLNVGNEEKLTPQIIKDTLKKEFNVDVLSGNTFKSETENTFVPELSRKLTNEELNKLSEILQQEAIPQYADGVGIMAGPKAKEWGDFNPDYFLTNNGIPLSKSNKIGKITIPKNVEKGIDAGGEVLAELESMKGVNIPHDDTELRNAILETVKDGKFEYVEIPYGGDKKISFTPTIKNLTEDTKKLANDQEKLITEKYNRSYSKKELDTVINAERQNGIKNYAVEDTDKYDKALAAEIKNQKFKKLTSAKDILSKIRSIKFDPTADSATQQARNDVKMALTNLLKKDFPGFAEMNNKIHKNFLVIDAFGNGLAKPGASIFEKLAGISGALAAAPQGIVASFATRNFASKLANHIFGGRYSLDKATKNFINESQPIIEKWISQGVSPKNIFSLIQEKYAYGKPSPETVLKIITELQGKADELSRQTTEVAAQKLAEQKSLIRIIKGMGNDANAIKEELVSQGINITDADAKTFAALNKNSGKSITPYIEKLARIGTIKQSTDQSQ